MHRAAELLKVAEKHLREARPDIVRITPAGDFRRGWELVGDLSLVAEVRHRPDSAQALSMGVELTARDQCRAFRRDASAGHGLGGPSRRLTRDSGEPEHEP